MSNITQIVPVLLVSEMNVSLDFYVGVLDFEIAWRSPDDGDGENCMIGSGEASLLLSTGTHLGNSPGFSGTLYFNMDGVEEFYERIKEQVEPVWPLEAMDYGSLEFGLRDPDGYVLAFSEPLEE